ncbi:ABC-three component system middle component 1 [Paenibacillus odorifer]|uniref:ABC-three component system middle component 1 n=1 Tax=Paenibacillus odorifer TaxID=189426 RepID=UPI0004F5CDEF|nr:ABC-three component system middle component 1 [Paenibacillus odorifer]AIQ73000.1 hypothetical protein PODO_06885 [Paenibacillus odorifer]
MNMSDLIQKLPFESDAEPQIFRFRNQLIKFFHVKRKEDALPDIVFSEYFFVDIPESVITLMMEDTDLLYFREFQSKLLSKVFFSNKTDLRWNIYLILIVENYKLLKDNIVLQKIENDIDYARKFIATPTDALEWMDKKWLNPSVDDKNLGTDPIEEWIKILESAQLTGCLSPSPFATQNVKQYLSGEPFNFSMPRNRKRQIFEDYEERIECIDEISFDGFRNHCFSNTKPILPTKVNLLSGSNGSGKTSVLESIEYAITNQIRRSSEFGDTLEEPSDTFKLICSTETQKSIPFRPRNPVAFYKKLAQSWYGVVPGHQSELNYYYHRFNFFDSEAAYRFALSESGHDQFSNFDYARNLSRLVFGDSILSTEEKWLRYKKEFEDNLKELLKKNGTTESILSDFNNQLSLMNNPEGEEAVDLESLLPTIRLPKSITQKVNSESTTDFLRRIELHTKSALPWLQEIYNLPFSNINFSLEQVRFELKQDLSKLNFLTQEKNTMNTYQKLKETELTKFQSDAQSIEAENFNQKQYLVLIDETLLLWRSIQKVIEIPSQVFLRRQLEHSLNEFKKKIETWDLFLSKFKQIFFFKNTDIFLPTENELKELEKSVKEKENSISQIKNQIDSFEKLMDQISTIFSRLQFLGKEFLSVNPHSAICPLCSHEHSNPNSLADAIHSTVSASEQGQNELNNLRKELESLQKELGQFNYQIILYDKVKNNIEQVKDAFTELMNYSDLEFEMNAKTVEEMLKAIHDFSSNQELWKNQANTIQNQLQALDETGYSLEAIINADMFQKDNIIYQEFLSQNSSIPFENYLITLQRNTNKKISENINLSERIQKQIVDLLGIIQQITFDKIDSNIDEQRKKIHRLEKFIESMNILFNDFVLDENINLRSWAKQIEKVIIQIELILKRNQNEQLKNQILLDIKKTQGELNLVRKQLTRCKEACEIMNKLRPLQDFTELFIKGNIDIIANFFKSLHAPREFDNLTLEKEGLILYRKSDNKRIKAYQMSSGQRASLALSVMFAVHLAAPNAPKFLIMDEPVANMDDLHLMNLLDLLRDFTLSGRQIFFTTANPEVANLFRRKFSFFEEHFTHFDFIRHSGEPVLIQALKYSASKEEARHQII